MSDLRCRFIFDIALHHKALAVVAGSSFGAEESAVFRFAGGNLDKSHPRLTAGKGEKK